ncbi:MAG TPA: response regulator [Tepidisphaeraceae bacterium]|nr:response regulator [Tepidisphaeraceae bacterium]
MPTILVVDDDPSARKPLARLLQTRGYTVVTAPDASVALAAAASCHPDLILLDVAIPGLDGLTMLWRLRETSAGRKVPVIVISGHDDAQTIERAQQLDVKAYLVKSRFTPAELLDLVRAHAGTPEASASEQTSLPTTTDV